MAGIWYMDMTQCILKTSQNIAIIALAKNSRIWDEEPGWSGEYYGAKMAGIIIRHDT